MEIKPQYTELAKKIIRKLDKQKHNVLHAFDCDCDQCLCEWNKLAYCSAIPECSPTREEISKQLRINADIIMKEITDHADKEIERIKTTFFPRDMC